MDIFNDMRVSKLSAKFDIRFATVLKSTLAYRQSQSYCNRQIQKSLILFS